MMMINKKAQLTQGLAHDSAATYRMRLKFDNAHFPQKSNL